MSDNHPDTAHTTVATLRQPPDVVTDEDIALREKNRNLEALVSSMEKVICKDWPYRDAARAILDILDPEEMPDDVRQACVTVILYCRKLAGRTLRHLQSNGKSA